MLWFRRKSRKPQQQGPAYIWGGRSIPARDLAPHYAALGITDSGKTLIVRMLLGSALAREPAHRALIYDPKGDMYALLVGMGIAEERIRILNPFDARDVACAWNIAADINDAASAWQFAQILVPDVQGATQPYFANAARHIAAELIKTLHVLAPGKWLLRDLVEAVLTPKMLETVLSMTKTGEDVARMYLSGQEETSRGNVLSTLVTHIAPFETVASLWSKNERSLSLHEWAKGNDIIIFSSDDANSASLEPLNRLLFRRASQLVLAKPEGRGRDQTWIVLDEVRLLGKLDGLLDLLLKGRSKGAHVVLAFQDIEGLRDVYGVHAAGELIGQCGNLAVLKLTNPDTMEWAARRFGDYEYWAESYSEGGSSQGSSWSVSRQLQKRESVLPQEFANFPLTRRETGLHGVFVAPGGPPWKGTLSPELIGRALHETGDVPAFCAREAGDQKRVAWDERDSSRLRISLPCPPRSLAE